MAAASIHRIDTVTVTFVRIGPPPSRRPAGPTIYPALRVTVPGHTARDHSAAVGYITELVHRHVHMFMPLDVRRYTVTVDVDAEGSGTVVLGESGTGRDLGHGTITPTR